MRISEVYSISNRSIDIPIGLSHIRDSISAYTSQEGKKIFFDKSGMEIKDLPSLVSYSNNFALWKGKYDWSGGIPSDALWFTDLKGNVQFETTGYLKNFDSPNPVYIISTVRGSPKRKARATDFYKHLILKDGFTLISDYQQTAGGSSIWERLNRDPEISVYMMRPTSSYMDKPKEETPIVDLPKNLQLALDKSRPSKYKLVTLTRAPAKGFMHQDDEYRLVATKKGTISESASVGATSSGNVASVANPHITNPYRKKGKPKQVKPKMQKPTDNALNMDVSLFGGGKIRR